MKGLSEEVKRKIGELKKKRIKSLTKLAKELPIDPSWFKVEYECARKNGHPNPKDAKEYARKKIIKQRIEQYIKMEENNINIDSISFHHNKFY